MSYCLCNPLDVTNKIIDQLPIEAVLKDFKIDQTLTSIHFFTFPQHEIYEYLREISEEAG